MEKPPSITQLEFAPDDHATAQALAKRLGYAQTAYTSSSSMWGLFCLPDNESKRRGCIIKTKEFGFLFAVDLDADLEAIGKENQ